jgi:hypothetical protein
MSQDHFSTPIRAVCFNLNVKFWKEVPLAMGQSSVGKSLPFGLLIQAPPHFWEKYPQNCDILGYFKLEQMCIHFSLNKQFENMICYGFYKV